MVAKIIAGDLRGGIKILQNTRQISGTVFHVLGDDPVRTGIIDQDKMDLFDAGRRPSNTEFNLAPVVHPRSVPRLPLLLLTHTRPGFVQALFSLGFRPRSLASVVGKSTPGRTHRL